MIKKIFLLIILIIMPIIVLAYPQGDVNGNNKVDAGDYILVRKHILKNPELTGEELKRADVNGKDGVTAADYIAIRQIIINGGGSVPTSVPTSNPTIAPTEVPIVIPTQVPTQVPTVAPTQVPTIVPTVAPTEVPTTADGICESVKGGASIDYKSFASLRKDNDDYYAIKAAHDCANKYNKPVVVTKGTYNIYKNKSNNKTIIVKTSTNLSNSKIYIHDEKDVVKESGSLTNPVYTIQHDNCTDTKTMKLKNLKEGGVVSALAGSSNGKYVKVTNDKKTVFVRYGYGGDNANSGHAATDTFRVDSSGKILDPLFWEYDNQNISVETCDIPVNTLTFKNGEFYTIVANVSATLTNKHFRRGILVNRSNVVVDGIDHAYVDTSNKRVFKIYYNYYGFIRIQDAADVTFKNSKLQAMKNYYGNKDNFIYDLAIIDAANITIKNVKTYDYDGTKEYFSKSSNQLKDNLWGIMGADEVKNITFDNCVLNRIDAHEFFYNLTIKNSIIGYWSIDVGGFGEMKIDNTEVYYANNFINLRGDYGSVWNGKVTVKNGVLHPGNNNSAYLITYDLVPEGGGIHDYGYDLHLPSVKVNGFKVDSSVSKFYIFKNGGDLSNIQITGGKHKFYYPSKNQIKASNITNKNGSEINVVDNIYSH